MQIRKYLRFLKPTHLALFAFTLLATLFMATTGQAQTMGTGNSQNQNATNTVSITSSGFAPDTITVNKGDSVTWTNNDSTNHTVTSQNKNIQLNSGEIKPGSSYSYTFSKSGTYNYSCSLSPNMQGKIIVQ